MLSLGRVEARGACFIPNFICIFIVSYIGDYGFWVEHHWCLWIQVNFGDFFILFVLGAGQLVGRGKKLSFKWLLWEGISLRGLKVVALSGQGGGGVVNFLISFLYSYFCILVVMVSG
jgi:hypothetical protein